MLPRHGKAQVDHPENIFEIENKNSDFEEHSSTNSKEHNLLMSLQVAEFFALESIVEEKNSRVDLKIPVQADGKTEAVASSGIV